MWLLPHKEMHHINIHGICLWVLDWKSCTDKQVCTPCVCAHAYRHLFLLSGPGWGGGEGHCSRSFAEIPKYLQTRSRHLHCCVALRAMKMIIKMIPHTSATIFRILAVLDASMATADSPAALAFCALKKQVSKLISNDVQYLFTTLKMSLYSFCFEGIY